MKRILLMTLFLPLSQLNAEMVYVPSHNIVCSVPLTDEINCAEYILLLKYCIDTIYVNMKAINRWGYYPDYNKVTQQCIIYLSGIKTKTAERLIEDLKEGFLYYPDQTIIGSIIPTLVKFANL